MMCIWYLVYKQIVFINTFDTGPIGCQMAVINLPMILRHKTDPFCLPEIVIWQISIAFRIQF